MWNIADYIDTHILPLKPSDKVLVAKELMLSQHVFHLPVVDEGKLVYWVNWDAIDNAQDDTNLADIKFQQLESMAFLRNDDHFFNALIAFNLYAEYDVLPVLSEQKEYKGLVRIKSLTEPFINKNIQSGVFSMVVLEMNESDYSLAALSNIVEYNRSAILQVLVNAQEKGKVWVNLVLNTTTLRSILSSFSRYEYRVVFVHNQSDIDTLIDDRYQSLMNYLDL